MSPRLLLLVCLAFVSPFAQADEPQIAKKYAVLIGVREYEHSKLPKLRFTENDVAELADILKPSGYEVILLTDSSGAKDSSQSPTKVNIDKAIADTLRKCKKSDTVVIAMAGHGVQFAGKADSFFCPKDARPFEDEIKSLVSVTKIYDELEKSFAGVKVLLVDACRDDPGAARSGSRGIDADNAPRPPRGVAALFSCSAGEIAYEHDKFRHGVFFHFILEGLRKEAREKNGDVNFDGLSKYVRESVANEVPKLIGGGARQSPNMKADLSGASPVIVAFGAAPARQAILACQVLELTRLQADKRGLRPASQAMFGFVVPGAAGDRMGIKAGDVILRVNDQPVFHRDDFVDAMQMNALGAEVRIAVHRDGAEYGLAGPLETNLSDPEIVRRTRAAALEGDVLAQASLGFILTRGAYSSARDPVEGVQWLQKADAANEPSATERLAVCFGQGVGVAKDVTKYAVYLRRAADLGVANCEYRLAQSYQDGFGVPKDDQETIKWYRKAIEQDHPAAMHELAELLFHGRRVEKNQSEALALYQRAAEHNYALSAHALTDLYHRGDFVQKDDARAFGYARRAADRNERTSMYNVGQFYAQGWGIPKDDGEALRWFEKSAELGGVHAQIELGRRYSQGQGVPKNDAESARWYHRAAAQNHPVGQFGLARAYIYGTGVAKDVAAGVVLLKKSAEQNHPAAWVELGRCYLNGRGVEKNPLEAVSLFRKAAAEEESAGEYWLGYCFENGIGVGRDLNEATQWYRKAAKQDEDAAKKALQRLNATP